MLCQKFLFTIPTIVLYRLLQIHGILQFLREQQLFRVFIIPGIVKVLLVKAGCKVFQVALQTCTQVLTVMKMLPNTLQTREI